MHEFEALRRLFPLMPENAREGGSSAGEAAPKARSKPGIYFKQRKDAM
jgi:hypothetical protein